MTFSLLQSLPLIRSVCSFLFASRWTSPLGDFPFPPRFDADCGPFFPPFFLFLFFFICFEFFSLSLDRVNVAHPHTYLPFTLSCLSHGFLAHLIWPVILLSSFGYCLFFIVGFMLAGLEPTLLGSWTLSSTLAQRHQSQCDRKRASSS